MGILTAPWAGNLATRSARVSPGLASPLFLGLSIDWRRHRSQGAWLREVRARRDRLGTAPLSVILAGPWLGGIVASRASEIDVGETLGVSDSVLSKHPGRLAGAADVIVRRHVRPPADPGLSQRQGIRPPSDRVQEPWHHGTRCPRHLGSPIPEFGDP